MGAHLVFIDESGFLLIPNVKRTWAPRGETPVLYHLYSQKRISAISALTVSPKRKRMGLYVRFWKRNISGHIVSNFLRQLFRHVRGPIFILWDRGKIHLHNEVKALLHSYTRLHHDFFPPYAPELNPAEYIWNQYDSSLANGAPENIYDLRYELYKKMHNIRKSQKLLWSCIYASEIPWKR